MAKKIVIVGAGPGGLSAGMILAHRGFDVQIFEREQEVGGRNGAIRLDGGFKFDVGPTFLLQKFTLDEMFEEVGEKVEDYLDVFALDPMYRLQYADYHLDLTQNPKKMKAQISKHFPGDEKGYDRFMRDHAKKFRKIFPVLQKHCSDLRFLLRPELYKAFPYVANRRSLFGELKRYFKHDELCLAFTFQSKYLGMSPWKCPSLFTILSYIEHKYGVYHVTGGLSEISVKMADIFKAKGGKLHLGQTVKSVITEGKKTKGIELESGEVVDADQVILNADFAYAANELFATRGGLKKYSRQKLAKKQYSCSAFMLYLGLDKVYEDLPHHTIMFAKDYRRNVDEIIANERPSDDMSIYVRNASVLDKTLAPEGHSNFYVLVPTINRSGGFNWNENKELYRQNVLDTLEERLGLDGLTESIVAEKMITPDDWERDFNVYQGAVFNLKHILRQMLYLRPRNKFECLDNCYLVGGGTHPGSGLPTIYESGRISANLICDQYGIGYEPPNTVERFM